MTGVYAKSFGCLSMVPELRTEGFKMLLGYCLFHGERTLAENQLTCQDDLRSCKNFFCASNERMDIDRDFERAFVKKVAQIIEDSPGMDHSKFARMVWGESDASVSRWRRLKNASKGGKPQSLSLSDAFKITRCMQVDFASFCWDISKELNHKKIIHNSSLPKPSALSA